MNKKMSKVFAALLNAGADEIHVGETLTCYLNGMRFEARTEDILKALRPEDYSRHDLADKVMAVLTVGLPMPAAPLIEMGEEVALRRLKEQKVRGVPETPWDEMTTEEARLHSLPADFFWKKAFTAGQPELTIHTVYGDVLDCHLGTLWNGQRVLITLTQGGRWMYVLNGLLKPIGWVTIHDGAPYIEWCKEADLEHVEGQGFLIHLHLTFARNPYFYRSCWDTSRWLRSRRMADPDQERRARRSLRRQRKERLTRKARQ